MPNKWAEFVYTKGFKLRLRGNFCDRMASNWLFHFVQCRVLVWDLLCRRSHWLYLCFFLRILGMVAMNICHCKPDMIFSTVTVGGMQSLCRKVCWVAGNLNAHCSQFSHDCPHRDCARTRVASSLSSALRHLPYYTPSMATVSQSPPEVASSSGHYEVIFDNAMKAYKKKTGKDLASDPLRRRLETCNSPDSVLAMLKDQIPGFHQSGSSDENHERLTKWVNPVVNVLYNFAATIGGAVSLVSHGIVGDIHSKIAL